MPPAGRSGDARLQYVVQVISITLDYRFYQWLRGDDLALHYACPHDEYTYSGN
jgi:hypothetical protein